MSLKFNILVFSNKKLKSLYSTPYSTLSPVPLATLLPPTLLSLSLLFCRQIWYSWIEKHFLPGTGDLFYRVISAPAPEYIALGDWDKLYLFNILRGTETTGDVVIWTVISAEERGGRSAADLRVMINTEGRLSLLAFHKKGEFTSAQGRC